MSCRSKFKKKKSKRSRVNLILTQSKKKQQKKTSVSFEKFISYSSVYEFQISLSVIVLGGILHDLSGMPAGVKFDPTDVEILEHLCCLSVDFCIILSITFTLGSFHFTLPSSTKHSPQIQLPSHLSLSIILICLAFKAINFVLETPHLPLLLTFSFSLPFSASTISL